MPWTLAVRLWAFYARRARRLLPASIFVLLFVAVGTVLLLPTDLWTSTAHEITASGFYVQNLWLASKAVTYSASNDVASPVQHYWSLSAEEWLGFTRVTVLRDIPTTGNRNGPQCLAVNAGKPQACSNPRRQVLIDDDMMRAARSMRHQVNLVDLSSYFCDAERCYAVIGGASVYFDYDHMSTQFSATLASSLLRRLPQA